ncbi:NACHT domain-containing protein [Streptomyces collinus]|uniref:NACHT domain-containing protein n=1 Tax=Streptomyces collinus TaxID=42684 RepID=UPI0036779589
MTINNSEETAKSGIIARGSGAVGAGGNVEYSATGKGSSVQDNRTIIIVNATATDENADLTMEQASSALNSYAEQIRTIYGRLDLEALIPTTEGEHPRVELREVFVPPTLRADPPQVELPVELHRRLVESGEIESLKDEAPQVPGLDREKWEQARQAYRERPAVKLLETVASVESRRTVLLGDPGSGKSTIARYLALALTSEELTGPLYSLSGLLPVVIELRRYADADWREKSFEDFLAYVHKHEGHAPAPALLHHCLENGNSLVVFDGLDELFDPRVRDSVTRRIAGFSARYSKIRIVVTSRIIGYNRHTLDGAGFRHYMLQSLNDAEIETFTARWYEAVCPGNKQDSERLRIRLIEAVTRSRPVRELAGNPLLLTILAIIARRQRLPRDRAGVYQHAVNVLIAHWDEDTKHLDLAPETRAIADLDDRDRREMLERLARHMQSGEGGIAGNNVLGEDVERVFTDYLRETLQLDMAPARSVSRTMVKQFRERNFILSLYGGQVYGFVHRAFLEYLAASDIVRRYEQRELTEEALFDGVFTRHASDPAWHEVLLLIVGQLGEKVAAPAIDKILALETDHSMDTVAPPAVLALRALTEVRRIGVLEKQSRDTAGALTSHWERHHVIRPGIAADIDMSLNSLGPNWVGARHIRRWLHASGGGIMSSAVAYRLFSEMEVLAAIASHSWEPAARANALPYLAEKWHHESRVFDCVRNALQDSDFFVRSDALKVIAGYWGNDPAVRELIKQHATEDPHQDVRSDALDVLAGHWADEPAVRELIQKRATEDPHQDVRSDALDVLAEHWADDPAVCGMIQRRAIEDAHPYVRQWAHMTLVDYWADDPAVRELIQQHATEDPHQEVRSSALDGLVDHWPDDPAVRELIQKRATEDPHERVRNRALTLLCQHWADDPAVRELIQKRATEDPHHEVQSRALTLLCQHWADDPAVRELIQKRATEDPHQEVRSDALDRLVDHWGDEPAVRELIQKRATEDPHQYVRQWALVKMVFLWPEDHTVRELIQYCAAGDPDAKVRSRALTLIGQNWQESTEGREFVQRRTEVEPDSEVRRYALDTLRNFWTERPVVDGLITELESRACSDNSPSTRDFLLENLKNSQYPRVRIAAARLLGSLWAAEEGVILAIQDRARADPDPDASSALKSAAIMAEVYAPLRDRIWG